MYRDLAAVGWILVGAVLAVLLVAVLVSLRWVAIRRPGGAITCGMRRAGETRWRRGLAAYRVGQLYWFPSASLGLRPAAVFERSALRLIARYPVGVPGDRLPAPGTIVVEFGTGAGRETLFFALSPDALTGLLAWLEAAPHRWSGDSC